MVRVAILAAALASLALAGCTGSEKPTREPPMPGGSAQEPDDSGAPWVLEAPVLEVGRSWTYALGGAWDATAELTVVVARADESGYLFAARNRDELVNEVAWDLSYMGEFGRALEPAAFQGEPHRAPLLVFPIKENATWTYYGTNVTAHRAELEILGESVPGVRVEGSDDRRSVLVEYAPAIGFVSRYEERYGDRLDWSLTLTAAGNVSEWSWFERGNEVFTGGLADNPAHWDPAAGEVASSPPADLVVTTQDDEVLVWWLGSNGARGAVAPPPGGPQPVTFEGSGEPQFEIGRFEAIEGSWRFTGIPGDAEGWAYLQGHALRWIEPG